MRFVFRWSLHILPSSSRYKIFQCNPKEWNETHERGERGKKRLECNTTEARLAFGRMLILFCLSLFKSPLGLYIWSVRSCEHSCVFVSMRYVEVVSLSFSSELDGVTFKLPSVKRYCIDSTHFSFYNDGIIMQFQKQRQLLSRDLCCNLMKNPFLQFDWMEMVTDQNWRECEWDVIITRQQLWSLISAHFAESISISSRAHTTL